MSLKELSELNTAVRIQLVIVLLCAIWHIAVAVISVVLFLILSKAHLYWLKIVSVGLTAMMLIMLFEVRYLHHSHNAFYFIIQGFHKNVLFWKLLFKYDLSLACYYVYRENFSYLIGFPLLIAGLMLGARELFSSIHTNALQALSKGVLPENKDINEKAIHKKLSLLKDNSFNGTLLGISKKTGRAIVIPDQDVNQMVLVLGTTGAGKTVTLQRFFQRAIIQGYPLIIVDGKPTPENVNSIIDLAKRSKRQFYGFNCGNYFNYDPLATGGYTELKDKIISLKDQWDHEYYRTVAEDYLQTTLEVLLKSGKDFDLKKISECLEYEKLALVARKIQDAKLINKVKSLQNYEQKALTGLQAHLNLLINSELGQYFEKIEGSIFNLQTVIENNAVAYFALPALRFPNFSKVLGKLVVNDIKAAIESDYRKRIFTVFDEFSVFAGEQVLNLVNMGRGKGIHAIFGTQGLADLQKIDVTFENQLLNCCNTIICHRLNDQEGAEKISTWIGTQDAFDITTSISLNHVSADMGSVRNNKSFIVHPDEIKQGLKTGEAFYASKVSEFKVDKIRVKF